MLFIFLIQANNTSTLECVEDALVAAEQCLHCICDIIDIIDGHNGICEDPNPGDCIYCAEEIQIAVDICNVSKNGRAEKGLKAALTHFPVPHFRRMKTVHIEFVHFSGQWHL